MICVSVCVCVFKVTSVSGGMSIRQCLSHINTICRFVWGLYSQKFWVSFLVYSSISRHRYVYILTLSTQLGSTHTHFPRLFSRSGEFIQGKRIFFMHVAPIQTTHDLCLCEIYKSLSSTTCTNSTLSHTHTAQLPSPPKKILGETNETYRSRRDEKKTLLL